jgi:hypothetical protein
MKIIFSRKGFDAGCGGCPSPIFPDGRICSLPIPSGRDPVSYKDLKNPYGGSLSEVISDLTKGTIRPFHRAHLDPDLDPHIVPRLPRWKPSLGQTGAAQSHLNGQGVGEGDIFIFFGWFRPVEKNQEGHWQFIKSSPSFHAMFGYLQIGKSIVLGERPDSQSMLKQYPWLVGHPHLDAGRSANNTLHLSSDYLKLSHHLTKIPGAGIFSKIHQDLILTAPNNKSKSLWEVPDWMAPNEDSGKADLTYHQDKNRWSQDGSGKWLLQTVAKGQEFVIDTQNRSQALSWVENLVKHHGPKPVISSSLKQSKKLKIT